jgi:hypothetical protein
VPAMSGRSAPTGLGRLLGQTSLLGLAGLALGFGFDRVTLYHDPLLLPGVCIVILLFFFLTIFLSQSVKADPVQYRRQSVIMRQVPGYRSPLVWGFAVGAGAFKFAANIDAGDKLAKAAWHAAVVFVVIYVLTWLWLGARQNWLTREESARA